jgi:hypothetical protein
MWLLKISLILVDSLLKVGPGKTKKNPGKVIEKSWNFLTKKVYEPWHTKWSHWCITASLNYKNTMINRITMETVACLRSKCHLKQNLIPSWPWSFWHTSCISDFRCKTKYTNKKFCRTPGPAYLAVLLALVIFCPLGPTNFKKSVYRGGYYWLEYE